MNETTKAMRRRFTDKTFPWKSVFKGNGIDIGPEHDPIVLYDAEVTLHQLPDGGGDSLDDYFPAETFDFIHGSQVLEHANNPVVMLASWVRCLKSKGSIIATIPDFDLYEKQKWPSKFNGGHKSTWSMTLDRSPALIHCKLPEWLNQFGCDVKRCELVTTNYNFDDKISDQTYDATKGVECFIEFVLIKNQTK